MRQDTIMNDSLEVRPLPKWLTNQRDGLNTYQLQKAVMKEDHSLQTSLISTGLVIFLTVIFLTVYFLRRNKKRM